jgi:light-regulated signal transduction histidine kinase (bacteriophytochrome)
VASHDLQEPLRTISAFLSLIEERYKPLLDDMGREYIGFSVDGARRMQQLIHDLLEYSRVATKGKQLQPIDTNTAVSEALTNLNSAIKESGADVICDVMPNVMGDSTQIMQLLQNLIGNAIKFRSPDRHCRVHLRAGKTDGMWEFMVKDNGIGIPEDAYDRIFIIFQRLHTGDEYAGTGIGLAVCKKIVERHGGRIWVDSLPGEGTTFHFTLQDAKNQ